MTAPRNEPHTTLHELGRTIMCARCEARPGEPCITIGGKAAKLNHAARMDALYTVYGQGYSDGLEDGRR